MTATCPTCSTPTRPCVVNGKPAGFCPECFCVGDLTPEHAGPTVRGSSAAETAFDGKEADLVAQIVKALRARGRTVLRCGQWRSDFAGSDAGVPDLLVACDTVGMWLALEVKTKKGQLSPAQRALFADGRIIIVRSVSEALEVTA